jgi:hypothetical protein
MIYILDTPSYSFEISRVLEAALQRDRLAIIKLLHVKRSVKFVSANLHTAMRDGKLATVKYLIESGCPIPSDALPVAMRMNQTELVAYLESVASSQGLEKKKH